MRGYKFDSFSYLSQNQQKLNQYLLFPLIPITMEAELTNEQYEQVLKYMEAVAEQNFQTATLMLKHHNFNLNAAINSKFGDHTNRDSSGHRNLHPNQQEQNDDQIVRRYIQSIQRQNQNTGFFRSTFNFLKNFTGSLLGLISEILLPDFILRKILRSKFYVLYKDEVKVNVQDDKLNRLLGNTKEKSHKCCFLVISPDSKSNSIIELLNRDEVVKKIQQSFYFIGFVQGDSQISSIQNQRPPEVLICRFNAFKQFVILKRFVGEQINSISVQQLNRITQESRKLCRKDKNVLVKYRNFIRRQYYGHMYVEEEEEEEINFIQAQQTTTHIRQQNEEYLQIQEEEKKRFEQMRLQEERKRKEISIIEEKEEERKVRRLSIPEEPTQGQFIRFSFRCPNGQNITRNFLSDEKVELLYHWVQTNDQIEFQDNKKREFEILYSFPPTSLTNSQDRLLKEVFESDQEKVLIKEI